MSFLRRNLPFILVCFVAVFFAGNLFAPNHSKKKVKAALLYGHEGKVTAFRPFVVLIPSYNNAKYYHKNLASVFEQDYPNFRVIYIDDASTDGTGDLVAAWLAKEKVEEKTTFLRNQTNKKALENFYKAIHLCKDEEILLFLDGDDWLAHNKVLSWLNRCYEDPEVWMTYGSFVFYPDYKLGPDKEIPEDVHKKHAYRNCFEKAFIVPPLRTGYAGLYKKIKFSDLSENGLFFPCTQDRAIMLPAIEMAKKHARYIRDVLYIYNRDNVINDDKVHLEVQNKYRKIIHSLPAYEPIKHWKSEET